MKCIECGGKVKKIKSDLPFESAIIGEVIVPNIEQEKCSKCGDVTVLLDDSDQITDYMDALEQEAINRLPIKDFITSKEAFSILGMTKQGFSQNPRIRRGLIMSHSKGGRKYYLKKSVLLFKEKRNGLFLIPSYIESYQPEKLKLEILSSVYPGQTNLEITSVIIETSPTHLEVQGSVFADGSFGIAYSESEPVESQDVTSYIGQLETHILNAP